MTAGYCPTCAKEVEVEPVEEGSTAVFCLECGEEFTPGADRYNNYVVGLVVEVEDIPKKKLKKAKVDVGEGAEAALTIVTNAKHCNVGDRVIVALEGAIVPAGAKLDEDPDAQEVKKTSVGGVKSEGMLCDAPMLGWKGGAAGILQRLPDEFEPGSMPPLERPTGLN